MSRFLGWLKRGVFQAATSESWLPAIAPTHDRPTLRKRRTSLPLWLVVGLGLTPWFILDGISPTGGILVFASVGFGLVLTGLGYLVVRISPSERGFLLLAPGAGLIVASALAQFAAYRGFPLRLAFWGMVIFSLPGLWLGASAMRRRWRRQVPHGPIFIALLAGISLVYFLPVSLRDAVRRADGGWQWVYVDSLFHHSLAATLVSEVSPPRIPTFGSESLVYHFGPHALAACISKGIGIEPGDALMRVVRLFGLLALAAAVFSLSERLARRRSERFLAGLFGLFFVFLLGSPYAVFQPTIASSAGTLPTMNWFTRQLTELPSVDAYKLHLVVGSGLWGLVAIFTVAGLLAAEGAPARRRRLGPEAILAPLSICLSAPAGLSLVAVVAGTHAPAGWRDRKFYASIGGSLALLAASLWLGGLLQPGSVAGPFEISTAAALRIKVLTLFKWLTFGLGIKALCLLHGPWVRRKPAVTFWLFFAGYLLAYLLIHENQAASELYALLFLSALAGAYAAAPAAHVWTLWRTGRDNSAMPAADRSEVDCTFVLLRRAVWLLAGCSLLVIAVIGFPLKQSLIVGGAWVVFASLVFSVQKSRASHSWRAFTLGGLAIFIAFSSLAWWKTVDLYTLDELSMTVTADPGLVESLTALRRLGSGVRLAATTHHSLPRLLGLPERSAMYAALAERPMLLEGWQYGSATRPINDPSFEQVRRDNRRLFESRDPSEVLRIARKYNVGYLLLEPGQTLGFDLARAPEIHPLPKTGTLTLLAVDRVRPQSTPRAR